MKGLVDGIRACSLLVCLLAGCTASDSATGWTGSTETLPNGGVRVTNPPEGLWAPEEQWRLTPEFVIGTTDGEAPTIFAAVSALEVDASGRIFVLDRQANELRIFGPDGEHIRSSGGSSEGPGEYANANGLAWMSEDSLLVVDQRGNRYSVLSRDGDYVRSVPRSLGFFGWAFSGASHGGRIYERSSVTQGEERLPAFLGTPVSARAAGEAQAGDTIMLPTHDAPLYESFRIQTERGGMVMGVPFAPGPVYHLDAAGHLWHGHGSANTILRSTLTGDTLSEIVLSSEPYPVTDQEIAEWEAGQGVDRFKALGGKLDLGRIPAHKAFFDALFVDSDGFVWLRVPAGSNQAVFSVLDPDGRYLGRVETEGMAPYPYVLPVARHGRLYMVGNDELDVQRVYVFRIEKPLSQ